MQSLRRGERGAQNYARRELSRLGGEELERDFFWGGESKEEEKTGGEDGAAHGQQRDGWKHVQGGDGHGGE